LLVLLVAVLAVGEWRGWPLLLQISAPAWSKAPNLLRAEGVSVELLWGDLWRAWKGEPLRIHRLAAATIDGEFERLADGCASWQFERTADVADGPATVRVPSFGRVRLDNGELRYRDEPLELTLRAVPSLNDGEPAPAGLETQRSTNLFRIRASGRWGEWPLKAELTPASVGRSSLEFKGHAGVTLPTTRAFCTEGELQRESPLWHVLVSAATVGASRLDGDFRYDAARRVALLSGRLGGPRLLLSDLGPAVGVALESAKPRKGGNVLPDRPFDLAALRVMDAEVALAIEEVDLNTKKLEPL
jgi:hypothetical protein